MEIGFVAAQKAKGSIALPVFEGDAARCVGLVAAEETRAALTKALRASSFGGRSGEVMELLAPAGLDGARLLLFGLGKAATFTDGELEAAVGAVVGHLLISGEQSVTINLSGIDGVDPGRAGLGARLAAYRFDRYRSKFEARKVPSLQSVLIAMDDPTIGERSWKRWEAVAAGVDLARDLVNEPPNVLTPAEYVARLQALAQYGLEVEHLSEDQMKALGMRALLGVAQGSANPPSIAILRWNGASADMAPVLFVGKGLTFDSGGLSLKPTLSMVDMKNDMGGSAAVVGLLRALAGRRAKVNAIGLVALVENMPDGAAQRPSDIVTSMSGQTIEVRDADAEGRLVLADALWYGAERFKPAAIIDLATLTGNVIATLGHVRAGFMASDDGMAEALMRAGADSGELVWRLPCGSEYEFLVESSVADVKNVGEGPMIGSSIGGAQFLRRFVGENKWCHIDIAGVSIAPGPKRSPLTPSWATGYGVRLLEQFVAAEYES